MSLNVPDRMETAITSLSALIAQKALSLQSERHHPGSDPDRMDDKIKRDTAHLEKLRGIRNSLEDIFAEWHV